MKNIKFVSLLSLLALLWAQPVLADIELFGKHPIFSAIKENDLKLDIKAPMKDVPSMTRAIELYIKQSNKT